MRDSDAAPIAALTNRPAATMSMYGDMRKGTKNDQGTAGAPKALKLAKAAFQNEAGGRTPIRHIVSEAGGKQRPLRLAFMTGTARNPRVAAVVELTWPEAYELSEWLDAIVTGHRE